MNIMKRNHLLGIVMAAAAIMLACTARAQTMPKIENEDGHYSLYVDGKPYFVLGGQSGNSSNWPSALPNVWKSIEEMNANTLEVPIYWECVEKEQGKYDFSSVQLLLDQVRERGKRLVLLWFGTWKNGSNHYIPQWMKLDSKTYFNDVDKNGKDVDTPSPHCKATMELDAKAFSRLMGYLKDHDAQHTVIMVQVENEPGSWQCVRDFSKSVDKLFNSEVPEALRSKEVLAQLETTGKKKGTWKEMFGDRADEYFNAWHIASYIQCVAAAGKKVNPLPMYVNVALRAPFGNPPATQYESGGATDNVIAIYKAAAPDIDLVAPDIYQSGDSNYVRSIELYSRTDNALFVPETFGTSKYLYEVITRGIGFSPFGVDGWRTDAALAEEYRLFGPIVDKIAGWQKEGRLYSAYQDEKMAVDIKNIDLGEWTGVLTFGDGFRNATASVPLDKAAGNNVRTDGHAMIVKLAEGEFYCIGSGVRFSFRPSGKNSGKDWQYLVVEEGSFNGKGEWVPLRILNGDQTDWSGPMARSLTALHIKVYSRTPRK